MAEPPYPPPVPPGPRLPAASAPAVVHVDVRHGGFSRAVLFVLGLFLFAAVFLTGIFFGVAGTLAAGQVERVVLEQSWRDGGSQRVAIVPVEGVIDQRQAEFVRNAVAHVLDDASIAGVILRVDSPGGGVAASDAIWREVQRLRDAGRPVVASFGGMAASGGYYVACGSDAIVAEPTCITGSIGVIAQVLTLEGLMDKIGVQPVTVVATGSPQKDVANDIFRTWNAQDRAKITTILDAAHARFRKLVSEGRAAVITDPAKIDAVSDGSIFTAKQALDLRLVDSIGYLDDAILRVEGLASVRPGSATVVRLTEPPTFLDALGGPMGRMGAGSARSPAFDAESLRSLIGELGQPRVMYLLW